MSYNLELDKAIESIEEKKAEKVLIQLPEGLKTQAKEIMQRIKTETDAEPVLDSEPVYGACCIPGKKEREEYDLVIHFGHTELVPAENVVYIPAESDGDVYEVTKKAAEEVRGDKIGLTTTTQHLHKLEDMKKAVENAGKTPITKEEGKFIKEAQVLGCCFISATDIQEDVDSYIFIGSGKFHPKGIANAVDKEVVQGNPYTDETTEIESGEWKKDRELRKDKARDAETFAIVNTPHPGQTSDKAVEKIKEKLKESEKEFYTIKIREITPNKIDYLPFDAFIVNACPRIVRDDWSNYKKPLLLPEEAKEVVKP